MSKKPLDEELTFFEEKQSEWLERYKGKYALIKGRELIDTFGTAAKAYEGAVRRFPDERFLVIHIEDDEPRVRMFLRNAIR